MSLLSDTPDRATSKPGILWISVSVPKVKDVVANGWKESSHHECFERSIRALVSCDSVSIAPCIEDIRYPGYGARRIAFQRIGFIIGLKDSDRWRGFSVHEIDDDVVEGGARERTVDPSKTAEQAGKSTGDHKPRLQASVGSDAISDSCSNYFDMAGTCSERSSSSRGKKNSFRRRHKRSPS